LTLTGINSGAADNPVVVIPSGGFAANTTSLTNNGSIAAQILVESPATDVTIRYLAVDGSGSNLNSGCSEPPLIGIYYKGASGTLNYVAARNQAQNAANFGCADSAALGIFIESGGSENSTVTIKNSTVHGYQKNAITANETGTTVTINGNSLVGAGPVNAAQNGIQVAFGATGTLENNIIADDDFNGSPSEGIGTGILIYGSGGLSITGNSIANTQTGIVTVTAGSFTANGNTVSNNQITNTHIGDGIDLCSDSNIVTGNAVFSSDEAGIHLDSTCGATGTSNTVSKNAVNEACAGILLGGSGNTISSTNTFANVANITLAGDTCAVAAPSALAKNALTTSQVSVSSQGRTFSPVRP
jgi:parallel beta-helix repeat protein